MYHCIEKYFHNKNSVYSDAVLLMQTFINEKNVK